MIEICSEWYTDALLLNNHTKYYVFGDNMQRCGMGGQAAIRRQPNAYGVATKRYPSRKNTAYFSDRGDEMECMKNDLRLLYKLSKNNVIVFPSSGIGTGLSEMSTRSPLIFAEMNRILLDYFGFDNNVNQTTT